MADGIGCTCAAYSEGECCCGVDWTPQEVYDLRQRITELESVIKSHGIPVKTYSGGVAHYCTKEEV